eukprot:TRINITY_DN14580_c0_g1_i1.p1 TRINITY_DN14580_c0_g1~~TRINITY_DN14580_c0_g1_i1.p1  ORF type:complete len:377 (+),score=74.48 TRINITY_DN14580_c0_g1_i1:150-1280(+)
MPLPHRVRFERPPSQQEPQPDLSRVQLVNLEGWDGAAGGASGAGAFSPVPGFSQARRGGQGRAGDRPTILAPHSRAFPTEPSGKVYDPTAGAGGPVLRARVDEAHPHGVTYSTLEKTGDGVVPAGRPGAVLDWRHRPPQAAAPEGEAELRADPVDGVPKTKEAFRSVYGGTREWDLAALLTVNRPPAPVPEEAYQRVDPLSGTMLEKEQFLGRYGGVREWELAAGAPPRGAPAAAEPYLERRLDPVDGYLRTQEEFLSRYHRSREWDAAQREFPDPPTPPSLPDASLVMTEGTTPRGAPRPIVPVGAYTPPPPPGPGDPTAAYLTACLNGHYTSEVVPGGPASDVGRAIHNRRVMGVRSRLPPMRQGCLAALPLLG